MRHKISEFYKKVYLLGSQIPNKRDRFGIYLKAETTCLDLLTLLIGAAFENRNSKSALLSSARIKTETLKRLFRIMEELKVILHEKYIELESDLQEISKMVNGWIRYLNTKSS